MSLNLDKSRWTRVTFGDVVRNVNDTVRDPAAAGIDRVIAMEHLDPGELRIERWGDIADGTTFTRRVRPGQTLFGKRRAYQRKVAYAEFDAICSGDIYTFEADPTQLLAEFLPFLVQSDGFFNHALGTSAGSLSPRTNWRDLANFEFDLPPLDEQQRLADLLWAVERNLLGVGEELVTLRELRSRSIEAGLASSVACKPLGEVATITSGVTLGPMRRSMPESVRYLRVANVQRGLLDLDEVKEIGATPAEIAAKSLRPGDVLVVEGHASVEEIGRAALWDRDEPVLFQNHLFRVRANEAFRSKFLLEWINSERGRAYIRTVAKSTSGLNTINSTVLKAMPVTAVTLQLQDKLLDTLARVDDALERVTEEVLRLRSLRSTLFEGVFGGR